MTTPVPPVLLTPADISSVIAMAWSDTASFESIHAQWGLSESSVRELMRQQLRPGSYRAWRKRVRGRAAKHSTKQTIENKGNE